MPQANVRRSLELLVCAAMVAVAGCALYSNVTVYPLMLTPSQTRPQSTLLDAAAVGDYFEALKYFDYVEAKASPSADELAALGKSELAAARIVDAERHLQRALALQPSRTLLADIEWDLAQAALMRNDFKAAAALTRSAGGHGLPAKPWHLAYLDALSSVENVYALGGGEQGRVTMAYGTPDIPRIATKVNDTDIEGVIDTGAVLTIISNAAASKAGVRSLGEFDGIFLGLIGEPIKVRFGIIDKLTIGNLEIMNVPVAVMPAEKMKFFVKEKKTFAIDLLLGASLLKEFRLELDFAHHVATFARLKTSDRSPSADQNLFFVAARPAVETTINRKGWYLFLVDTGSEITYLNQTTINATSVRGQTKIHGAVLEGLGGAMKHGEKISGVEVGIGGWGAMFTTLPLYEHDSPTFGIVGENFLSNFKVVIDFGHMRMDFIHV